MELPHYVEEVMTYPVLAVQPGAGAREVAALLARRRIGAVPVVDSSLRVLGVVAASDLAADDRAGWITARDLMSWPAVIVTAQTTVDEALALLASRGVGRLPVVDPGGRLFGIVSRGDLLHSCPPDDDRIKRLVLDRAISVGARIDYVAVRGGTVRVRAHVARRSQATVLERLVGRIPGVTQVRAVTVFDLDDLTGAAVALGGETM